MTGSAGEMPFLEHLEELRSRILRSLAAVVVGFGIGLWLVLRIVESGFDRIPLARRAEAFRMNEGGWAGQAKNLERYVSLP